VRSGTTEIVQQLTVIADEDPTASAEVCDYVTQPLIGREGPSLNSADEKFALPIL
jgi:hypothetical protein